MTPVTVHWPDGRTSQTLAGRDWLLAAREAGMLIPTGCLGGSCGACESEVNERSMFANGAPLRIAKATPSVPSMPAIAAAAAALNT
ncbi:MAG: 2Fe-2S iron-sulfur cluster-binding protein, partial [Synechococcaceae cyanobacterium]